jgi:hypothetical protein
MLSVLQGVGHNDDKVYVPAPTETPYALDQVQKGNSIYSSKYILHIFYDDYTLCIFVVLEVSKKHLHLDNGEITIPHVDIYKFCPRSTRDAG